MGEVAARVIAPLAETHAERAQQDAAISRSNSDDLTVVIAVLIMITLGVMVTTLVVVTGLWNSARAKAKM